MNMAPQLFSGTGWLLPQSLLGKRKTQLIQTAQWQMSQLHQTWEGRKASTATMCLLLIKRKLFMQLTPPNSSLKSQGGFCFGPESSRVCIILEELESKQQISSVSQFQRLSQTQSIIQLEALQWSTFIQFCVWTATFRGGLSAWR